MWEWIKEKIYGPTDVNQMLEDVDQTLNMLEKRERVLQKKITEESVKAKEHIKKKNKPAATACLKKKKQYEQQLLKVQNNINNLDTLRTKQEEAATDIEVHKSNTKAAQNLKEIYANMTVEEVEREMDKVRNTMDDANEISNALNQTIDTGIDEDELDDELDMLQNEINKEQITKIGKVPSKDTKIGSTTKTMEKKKTKEEEEEEELEREAASLLAN